MQRHALEVPPLPQVPADEVDDSKTFVTNRKKNSSMTNLTSELTFQNLNKFNYSSMDEFNNNPNSSMFNPLAYQNQQLSVVDIVPKPPKIDQTIGIPLTFDAVDNTGNAFYPSLGPPQYNNINNNEVSNDYEYHQVPTTIHQYPLISGSIPSASQSKMNFNTLPTPAMMKNTMKKEPQGPTSSILSNPNNSNANNLNSIGEKNRVKFSDTVEIAVVPEISRKEKIANFNERMKRKPYPGMMDPRRELAESLPLCHPEADYLKDFSPVVDHHRSKEGTSSGKSDDKKKPAIKVVHFGVV
jgi:WD repeat-containing and planar cell polarity effector protein